MLKNFGAICDKLNSVHLSVYIEMDL